MLTNFPEHWGQEHRDALNEMLRTARADGLWFVANNLATDGPMWLSPDELEDQFEEGTLRWGAVNWKLKPPAEYLDQTMLELAKAHARAKELAEKVVHLHKVIHGP